MDILVLGGTYFLGKAFVEKLMECQMKCKIEDKVDYSLTLVNRGSRSLEPADSDGTGANIKEHHMDRHYRTGWEKLDEKRYDVVVDFCGYNEKDIELLFEAGIRTRQYVFVSTVDVYSRGHITESTVENTVDNTMDRDNDRDKPYVEAGDMSAEDDSGNEKNAYHAEGAAIREDYPYETRHFPGPIGDYISGKVALERELKVLAEKYEFKYTIFRPAVIYGPGNYAGRESMYFKWMVNAGQILSPVDATGYFQLVFVRDVADIMCKSLLNATAFDRAYNVCTNEKISYKEFAEILKKVAKSVLGREIEEVEITTDMVLERQLPLPFPLFKEESYFYDGSCSKGLEAAYTDLYEGLCVSLREYLRGN